VIAAIGDALDPLSASRKADRMAGIDIGVHRTDRRARVGKLTWQGSPQGRGDNADAYRGMKMLCGGSVRVRP
jgi:hypothetical protein